MKFTSFREELYENLRNPEYAAAYLQGAYDDSREEFLHAIHELLIGPTYSSGGATGAALNTFGAILGLMLPSHRCRKGACAFRENKRLVRHDGSGVPDDRSAEAPEAEGSGKTMSWVTIDDYQASSERLDVPEADVQMRWYCEQLEEGEILFYDGIPFELPEKERTFLLSQRLSDPRYHKNISYRPAQDEMRGFTSDQPEEVERLHRFMRSYSQQITQFLSRIVGPYARQWSMDYASYRPLEEQGRDLSLHKRNDLIHVDAFPSRPTRGGRILRIFTNINPTQPRIWLTTDRFEALANRYASDAGLPKFAAQGNSPLEPLRRGFASLKRAVGIRAPNRSPYDRFMLRFHDALKENAEFQAKCPKIRLVFPPNTTWIAMTDAVPHAALSGQYALEQTYIVPISAMVAPQKSPLRVLETLSGRPLSNRAAAASQK